MDIGFFDLLLIRVVVCEIEKGKLLMICSLICIYIVIGYVFLIFEFINNFELDCWWVFFLGYNLYNLFIIKCDKNIKV